MREKISRKKIREKSLNELESQLAAQKAALMQLQPGAQQSQEQQGTQTQEATGDRKRSVARNYGNRGGSAWVKVVKPTEQNQ